MAHSFDSDDPTKRRLRLVKPAPYEVGHGKPPVATQFKPGRSGNPKGRPKGARNRVPAPHEDRVRSIILEEAYRSLTVSEKGKPVRIPLIKAVVRSLGVNAAKGNNRAADLFTELVIRVEAENQKQATDLFETALEYKVKWTKELERRKKLGLDLPDPIPHPDHVEVNGRTGKVRFIGPMTQQEKELWDSARQMGDDLQQSIDWSEKKLKRERDPAQRQLLMSSIEQDRSFLETINRLLNPRKMA